VETRRQLGELRGHSSELTSVAFSADGTRFVTGSHDHTARVWDANTFNPLGELKGHSDIVAAVAITPDGSRIVTRSLDGTARVWELFPMGQLLIDEAKMLVPRCLTPAQRELYHLPPEPPGWCKDMHKWSGGDESPRSRQSEPAHGNGGAQSMGNYVFVKPTVGGVRVDHCLHDARECGGYPAATEFCRKKNFTRAIDWRTEMLPTTMILSDSHRCEGSRQCDGFSVVICE
jgi:hypothetical protein